MSGFSSAQWPASETTRAHPMDRSQAAPLHAAVQKALRSRPAPIRAYDQIHMRLEDLTHHLFFLEPFVRDRRVLFMGDSDGVAIGLGCLVAMGLTPGPSEMTLVDFDERVLRFNSDCIRQTPLGSRLVCRPYNVFDPVPPDLIGGSDFFHTNPPYGRYNKGNSVLAFVHRAVSMTMRGGSGTVILANDSAVRWTAEVLGSVIDRLTLMHLAPVVTLRDCHRYHLDDDPDLRSGLVVCENAQPEYALSAAHRLPPEFRRRFYGRRTIPIPQYINADEQLSLAEIPPQLGHAHRMTL